MVELIKRRTYRVSNGVRTRFFHRRIQNRIDKQLDELMPFQTAPPMKGGEGEKSNNKPNQNWLNEYATQIKLLSDAYRRLEELSQRGQHDLAKGSSSVLLLPFNLTENGLAIEEFHSSGNVRNKALQNFVFNFENIMLTTSDFEKNEGPRLGIVLWVLLAPEFHRLKLALGAIQQNKTFTSFTRYTQELGSSGNASPIPASYLQGLTQDNLNKRLDQLNEKIGILQKKLVNPGFQWIDWFQLYLCVAEQIILQQLLPRQNSAPVVGGKRDIPARMGNQGVQWARTNQGRLRMIRKRNQRGGEEQLTATNIKSGMETKIEEWKNNPNSEWTPYGDDVPINKTVRTIIPILYLNPEGSAMNTLQQLNPQLKQLFANIQSILQTQ
jgi:hypothetical protein